MIYEVYLGYGRVEYFTDEAQAKQAAREYAHQWSPPRDPAPIQSYTIQGYLIELAKRIEKLSEKSYSHY